MTKPVTSSDADAAGVDAPHPLDPSSRLRVSPSVYVRSFEAEIVVLDFARGEYYGLDEIGAEVFRLLESGASVGAVADALVARYEVTRETALDDVLALVGEMRAASLVTIEGA